MPSSYQNNSRVFAGAEFFPGVGSAGGGEESESAVNGGLIGDSGQRRWRGLGKGDIRRDEHKDGQHGQRVEVFHDRVVKF
jgi:hypothetical protein